MIKKMSHTPIFVLDQDSAIDFYVNKLGFELRNDAPMGPDFRWVTVSPPGQPDLEIILMATKPGMAFDEQTASTLNNLVRDGKLGAGVFHVDDIYATYKELTAKGVQFKQPPKEEFYGIEAIMLDDSGNWFSVSQEKK